MAALNLTQEHTGRQFQARPGDTVTVRLPENPTTGYRWMPESAGGASVEPNDSTFIPANAATGAGGTRVFTYVMPGAGSVRLRLLHRRAWESEGVALDRFETTIGIQE